MTPGVCQEWGHYNGAIGEVVDIGYRDGQNPPMGQAEAIFESP